MSYTCLADFVHTRIEKVAKILTNALPKVHAISQNLQNFVCIRLSPKRHSSSNSLPQIYLQHPGQLSLQHLFYINLSRILQEVQFPFSVAAVNLWDLTSSRISNTRPNKENLSWLSCLFDVNCFPGLTFLGQLVFLLLKARKKWSKLV